MSTKMFYLCFLRRNRKPFLPRLIWAHYSMLKTMLNVKRNIDVSKFYKLSAFLKRKSEGYKPKKSENQIDKFLLEAPDKDFLMIKVALIFGVAGACRVKELHQLTISDVTDMDHALLVNVRNTKNNVDRNFIINNSNKNGIDLIEVCRKYMALRKPETTHSRFFVRYEKSQCTVQAIGKIPQKVAEYLNLPNSTLYTGHCFRRTSASLLADSGASIDVLKRHGGWKSASIAEGYIENSINTKKIVADSIFGLGVGNSTQSASAHQVSGSAVSASSASSTSSKNNIVQNTIHGANRLLNIVNCSNVNIHVNINTNNKDL
ncbi:hypothetical protein NQ315_002439 [Exocentrus adspersus]|uniref:Tyr recombinase domain-containing protein n=1 Tax=Exocentrus adspersus TaxID=1586481 RepID=A0AAV8VHX7_9CUCU|nr:hypothetical protein NQ315_002439 [Exocentrus adspersus]